MDYKNQYCLNLHTTQSILQIQSNQYQNSNNIFHRNRTNKPKIWMEPQKIPNSQSNCDKELKSWSHHTQIILKSYSNQSSMVLAQKHTQVNGTEIVLRNKSIYINAYNIQSINITKDTRIYNRERIISLINNIGKAGQLCAKEYNYSYSIY